MRHWTDGKTKAAEDAHCRKEEEEGEPMIDKETLEPLQSYLEDTGWSA